MSGRQGRPHGPRAPGPRASRPGEVEFLYEDEDIVAVAKPEGLAVIAPDGSRSRSLLDMVTEHLRRGNPRGRAALLHRIDRDTSGIVVFGKSATAKKVIMGAWDEIVAERRYSALVEGEMEGDSGLLDSWLVENRAGTVFTARPGERGALRALTRWRLVGTGTGLSLLELRLETGRKHQIRVQLAAAGHPVAGDPRYGARSDPLGRLCLHAASISLDLPGREDRLIIEYPAPRSFAAALAGRNRGKSPR